MIADYQNAVAYSWKRGGILVGSGRTLLINKVNLSHAGNDYTLEVNNGTCTAVSGLFAVNVSAAPDLGFTGSTQVCVGATLSLNARFQGATSYTWKKGGSMISNSQTLTIANMQPANAGNDYSLEINTGTCTFVSEKFTLSVFAQPDVTFSGNTSVCEGTNLTLTANHANASAYVWKKSGVIVGTQRILVINNMNTSQAGNDYTLEVDNGLCNKASENFSVVVTQPPNTSVSIEPLNGQAICAGEPIAFKAIPVNGGTKPFYTWKINNVVVGNNTDTYTTSNWQNGDLLSVEMISSLACTLPAEASIDLLASNNPTVHISTQATAYGYGCDFILKASGAKNYTWEPSADIKTIYANGDSVLVTGFISTTFIVTGINEAGCKSKDTIQISINPITEIFIPTLFTPNNDGQNDRFWVHGKGIAEINLKIFDRAGNLLYEANTVEQATQIGWDGTHEGATQPAGMYIWQISGKFSNGQPLSYEGKKKGKINLFR